MAISDTTSAERNQVWLDEPTPLRSPSLRLSSRFVRNAANAGAKLQSEPVSKARSRAKPATNALIEMESMRGIDSGRRRNAVRTATAANAKPSNPPAALSSRPSNTDPRIIAMEPAPRASRTAYSWRRRMARTSSSPATFTQAISRTMETAMNRARNNGCTSPTALSRSSDTSPRMWIAAILAGKFRMISWATRSASCAACTRVTPSFKRATMW